MLHRARRGFEGNPREFFSLGNVSHFFLVFCRLGNMSIVSLFFFDFCVTWRFFSDGFLFPVKELGLLTNPGHWVRVLDVVGSYMYIVL
jgi:hypothetical protein